MSAMKSDRNVGTTKKDWSMVRNPEDNENVAQSRRQQNVVTSPSGKSKTQEARS